MSQRSAMLIAAAVVCSGFLIGASAVARPGAPAARAAALSGTWGTAEQVPGSNTLNQNGHADIASVSCVSAGNCSAGGAYASGIGANGKPITQAMVVTESGDRWGTARPVPGAAGFNTGGSAQIDSVSCTAPGDCGAGGYYTDASGNQQAFVVTEAGGIWRSAREVPGTAAVDLVSPGGEVLSVSCAMAGNCSAGGYYTDASGQQQAFIATETGGIWHTAQEVPGSAALNAGGYAAITSVSCAAAGDCNAGGYYASASVDRIPTVQALVVTETGGTWHTAKKVLGMGSLNRRSPGAEVFSVSCGAAGECSAGGAYTDISRLQQAFIVTETGGIWGTAQEVPGTADLNVGGQGEITSVSCAATGECSAGGLYASSSTDHIPTVQAFVDTETGGTWGTAQEVPGSGALNTGGYAQISSVSCAAPGECSAGGEYTDRFSGTQTLVVDQTGGTWGTAQKIRDSGGLNKGGLAMVNSVSCPAPGDCAAVGAYMDANFSTQAFVADESGGTWGTARYVSGTAYLDKGSPGATAVTVSCGAVGDCSLGGHYYAHTTGIQQAFVASETSGTWGSAQQIDGAVVLHKGQFAAVESVSCTSAGNCGIGGYFPGSPPAGQQAFVDDETGSP